MGVKSYGKVAALAGVAGAVSLSMVAACSSSSPKLAPASPSAITTAAASPPSDFSNDYTREHNGVVSITIRTCGETFAGSGFLVSSSLVVTAAHVVAGETTVSITDPVSGATIDGRVIGYDASRDVALIQTGTTLTGYVFSFAATDPQVGSRIAAIGYPLGNPESLTAGTVSGLDRTITVNNGETFSHLIQVDTPLNPGNSGGPMIGLDGSVEGIADAGNKDAQGINYAVAASDAATLINQWRQNPNPMATASCQAPASTQAPAAPSSTAVDTAVATLNQYVNLINAQDYPDAYALFSSAAQQRLGSEANWQQAIAGSFYANTQVLSITDLANGAFDVELAFTSTQPEQSCKNWDLDYQMVPAPDGAYLIDNSVPHNGGSGYTPC